MLRKGTNQATDIIEATGACVAFNKVQNTTLQLGTRVASINDRADNTAFELKGGLLQVTQDAYLAAAGCAMLACKPVFPMHCSYRLKIQQIELLKRHLAKDAFLMLLSAIPPA